MREYIGEAPLAFHLDDVVGEKGEFLFAVKGFARRDACAQQLAHAPFDFEEFAGAAIDLLLDCSAKANVSSRYRQNIGSHLNRFRSKREKRRAVGCGCGPLE